MYLYLEWNNNNSYSYVLSLRRLRILWIRSVLLFPIHFRVREYRRIHMEIPAHIKFIFKSLSLSLAIENFIVCVPTIPPCGIRNHIHLIIG